jgi:hypothetical protein
MKKRPLKFSSGRFCVCGAGISLLCAVFAVGPEL